MNDTFRTIISISEGLYKEKGSRFIAFAFPVANADEIKTHLSFLQKQYHDARHICYAYVLGAVGEEFRANDNGEPSGTAGRPILGAIRSHNLTNILIAVVRYFGGIKLGTSGLITAYKAAAQDAIDNASVAEQIVYEHYALQFEYSKINEIMRIIKEENAIIENQTMEEKCMISFKIRKKNAEKTINRLLKINVQIIRN